MENVRRNVSAAKLILLRFVFRVRMLDVEYAFNTSFMEHFIFTIIFFAAE